MSDATTITSINVDDGLENIGGCTDFHLSTVEMIVTAHMPVQNVVNLQPEQQVIFCSVTRDTAKWSEKQGRGGGNSVESTFECVVPADTIAKRQNVQAIARHGLVLEVPDNNGVLRRMGNWNNPARMTYKYDTQGEAAGRNQYLLSFTWTSDGPAPIIDYTFVPDFSDMETSGS